MSRITKEEIEKTKCGRFLLSDENIYLSIYSLNSYVFEYNLLNTEDRILYHRLQDKFDARLINGVITRVHWIDPEGKPELELAEDYENKANIAESRGYSRYAGILRGVADEFKREAKSNILEAKNGDDE